jgi:serine phosphatase RsbU (regulator of sigma subunit)
MQGPVVAAVRADLATETDPVAPHLAVHGQLHAAEGVLAGDWWGLIHLDGDRTALIVLDVSGHGALAGLVTMRLRAVMSVALRSGFDPATAMHRAATSLADSAAGTDGRFATAVVVLLDPRAGSLTWANAGHPAGWLMPGGRTGERVPLDPTGPLLSALGGTWSTSAADLGIGDVVLVWSDGLVESRHAADELTDAALARVIEAIGTREPAELVAALLAAVRADAPEWRRDDVTAVAVRRTD